ncbi:MAG: S-methyl-5'-thioinosine phosphorylase [Pseudomonadota bacterium]
MLAIIGGTGLASEDTFNLDRKESISTIYGKPSSDLLFGSFCTEKQLPSPIVFLSRHGFKHNIPPHKVNYRANIQALKEAGVNRIIAVNAVGGISEKMAPGCIVLPHQLIDYSYGREHTFFAENLEQVTHIDFTNPYTPWLIKIIIAAADNIKLDIEKNATYACTQGPRLETSAEIQRLLRDGCDIVGMTGMPEAALAREIGIDYASISFVANWGAGLSSDEISMTEIEATIKQGMDKIKALLVHSALLMK